MMSSFILKMSIYLPFYLKTTFHCSIKGGTNKDTIINHVVIIDRYVENIING